MKQAHSMRVAVAGLGWWGKEIIRSLAASRKFEVVVGIDPFPTEEAKAFLLQADVELATDLAQVLARSDIDGVILATPHSLHEEQVLAALETGKQVFCEKPLAMTSAGARRMLEAAASGGRVLGMGHERRFEPAVAELMRMVRAGELGRLLHVETNVSHDLFRKLDKANWRLDQKDAPAGMMTAVGIHITDIFVALAGPAESVCCVTDSMTFEPPAQDYVTATIKFRSGTRGTITFISATPFHGRIAVFGDKGWVELVSLGNVDQGLPTIFTHCTATGVARVQRSYEATSAVVANFESWADAVTKGSPYPFTSAELLENIKLFEAIVRSGRNGGAQVELETPSA
ncbi:MAG: Gfo/Idh/MocA family oxidoreductase [Burkholderiales bacterium]|nr:Gfo/Idh/MocA family oxidoreductase [Burkholderiales bacterium]